MMYNITKGDILKSFKCKCIRCEHEWLKRQDTEPVACPKCKSSLWNIPRKNKRPVKEK